MGVYGAKRLNVSLSPACRLKPFKAAMKLSFGLTHLVPIEVDYMAKILECFHQKP